MEIMGYVMNKLRIAREQIQEKIIDPNPPEKDVAIMLFLYGITEGDFIAMRRELLIDDPTHLKILNYLRDEWRLKT